MPSRRLRSRMLAPARATPHDQYAVVPNARLVIEFLSSLRRGQFQSHVGILPDGRVALRSNARIKDKLERASQQAGWNIEFLPLTIREKLTHRPLCDVFLEACYSPRLDERWAKSGPQTRFLLRADSEDQAQRLKDLLLEGGQGPIELRFVSFEPVKDASTNGSAPGGEAVPPSTSAWYWSVAGPPPGKVIDATRATPNDPPNAWYEATTCGRNNQILLPVHYAANVDDSTLERINWCQEDGLVLLPGPASPGTPPGPVSFVRIGREHAQFEPLIHVADVQTNPRPVEVGDAAAPPTTFPVTVRLLKSMNGRTLSDRAAALEREIETRQQMYAKLLARLEHAGPELGRWEPLFVYRDRDGHIPKGLQRLLHEWCDEAELQWLYYARIHASSWEEPGCTVPEGEWLHVLTTASALGKPSELGQTAWLEEYAPHDGRMFRTSPGWSEHGLFLFEPDDLATRLTGSLSLYPDVPPGPVAARNLGAGMVPTSAGEAGDYLVLLRPGRTTAEPLEACRIPRAAFQPLVGMIPWGCSVTTRPVAVDAAPAPDAGIAAQGAHFVEEVAATFAEAAARAETDLLQSLTATWNARVTSIEQERDRIRAAVASTEAEAARLETLLTSVQHDLRELRDRQARTERLASRADTDWAAIVAAAEEGQAIARRARSTTFELREPPRG